MHVLIAGSNAGGAATAAAQIVGVAKVLHADAAYFEHGSAENVAAQVLVIANDYSHILFPATAAGKNVAPRVAANTKATRRPATATTKPTRVASPSKAAAAATQVAIAALPKRRAAPKTSAPIVKPSPTAPIGTSKQARLIALLGTAAGASIAQMIALTGWQAHTMRGTISGVLRTRLGLNVACAAGDSGVSIYRIVFEASA